MSSFFSEFLIARLDLQV